jgi:nicotinamidase-related amidase
MTTLSLDPQTTALVLIDLQRGILAGALTPNSGADVIANGASLARAFRERGALVVLVNVDPGKNGELMPRPPADNPRPPFTLTPDWTELAPELDRQPSDVTVTKHQPNAFYCTDLEVHLRRRNIRTIVLGGIATNLGVEATARAAYERGFEQVFVADAMTARGEVLHTHPVTQFFPTIGMVRSTAEIIAALTS